MKFRLPSKSLSGANQSQVAFAYEIAERHSLVTIIPAYRHYEPEVGLDQFIKGLFISLPDPDGQGLFFREGMAFLHLLDFVQIGIEGILAEVRFLLAIHGSVPLLIPPRGNQRLS